MQIPENLLPLLLGAALHIGVAIVIFLVGRWLAAFTRSRLRPALQKTKLTESMVNLAVTLSFYSIWVATIVAGLAVLGFPIETLLTFAGVTIVILGIALQQSLKDFATAVIFVLFKPFEVGDLIQTKGITGTVQEMQFFNTVLLQGDNKVAILANAEVQLNGIINFTKMGTHASIWSLASAMVTICAGPGKSSRKSWRLIRAFCPSRRRRSWCWSWLTAASSSACVHLSRRATIGTYSSNCASASSCVSRRKVLRSPSRSARST